MYDVIIIGSGPAGMTAAIYAARACLDTLLLERQPMGGGQMLNTAEVDNYPAVSDIGGFELGQKFMEHVEKLGIRQVTEDVKSVECTGEVKKVVTDKGTYEAVNLIYAAGASHRTLGVEGEEKFRGRGVSYCATCDGAFFRGKAVAVIGGGDTALEDALFLSKGCEKVYLVHRRDTFRGAKTLQNRVMETGNIEIVLEAEVEKIIGGKTVEAVEVLLKAKGEKKSLAVEGVFLAVGIMPQVELLKGQVEFDENGYVLAGEDCRTSAAGVYAAGDVRSKKLRQIITAAADGANAVADIVKE